MLPNAFSIDAYCDVSYNGARPSTLSQAFDMSISKWKFILECLERGTDVRRCGGWMTCGLCLVHPLGCEKCPVMLNTGYSNCEDTPYESFLDATGIDKKMNIARQEIAFLERLRDVHCGEV